MEGKRVFVNAVDSYSGKILSQSISNAVADFFPEGQTGVLTVVGTLLDSAASKPRWVSEIVDASNKENLKAELLKCSHIVYDIQHPSQLDEATWAIQTLDSLCEDFAAPKTFVLASTVMTWAKTKPNDQEDPEAAVAEDEYRRRRPHMNFKPHVEVEKLVMKVGKKDATKLATYVVAAGLLYGEGEALFHQYFKTAWQLSAPHLEIFGSGENALPCIHVRDLGGIVGNVLATGPATRYIVAVDEGGCTLEDIVRCISTTLGTGKVVKLAKEEALSRSDLNQTSYDCFLLNLRLETSAIKDLGVQWVSLSGFVENIATTVAEFKKARGLQALKVCVLGPPASGKSHLARQLCEYYSLPHVHVATLISGTIDRLNAAVAALENPEVSAEETEKAEAAKEELAEARTNLESNGGRYGDDLITKWCREYLGQGACRNQGYVLDGLPKTTGQAKDIFGAEEQDLTIIPEFVLALEATDEFLKERVMNLPESAVAGTHNTEEGLLRRLARYRTDNTEDATVLNFFDLLEIHPVYIAAEAGSGPLARAITAIGAPHNYGPTPEEAAALLAAQAQASAAAAGRAREESAKLEAALAADTARAAAAWADARSEVLRQQAVARDSAALPLRSFLVKNVLPTLTKGLMEVCEVRPDDPIDFLAEYLFKNNPRID